MSTATKKRTRRSAGYVFDLRDESGTLDVYSFIWNEMQAQGMSVPKLADAAGISHGTLYRWMGDEPPVARGPFARQLVAIFDALGYAVVTRKG